MSDIPAALTAAIADRYRIEHTLGQGGMATVYLAEDLRHHRKVAVKVLRPELAATLGPDRFLREIETTAGLRHPHILPLYDSGRAKEFLYYVMPLVEGESLRERLQRERQLPLGDALRITREVADALGYAHGRGVIHRDIKPENILLERGHAVVADFGIARAVTTAAGGERLTQAGMAVGTVPCMSPEPAAGVQPGRGGPPPAVPARAAGWAGAAARRGRIRQHSGHVDAGPARRVVRAGRRPARAAAAGRRLRRILRGRRLAAGRRERRGGAADRGRVRSRRLTRRPAHRVRRDALGDAAHLDRGRDGTQRAAGVGGQLGGGLARRAALVAGREAHRLPGDRAHPVRHPRRGRRHPRDRRGDRRQLPGREPRLGRVGPRHLLLVLPGGGHERLARADGGGRHADRPAGADHHRRGPGRAARHAGGRRAARLHRAAAQCRPLAAAGGPGVGPAARRA